MNILLTILVALQMTPAVAQQSTIQSTILFNEKEGSIPTKTGPVRWNMKSKSASLRFRSSKPLGITSIRIDLGYQGIVELRAIYNDGIILALPITRSNDDACLDVHGGIEAECFIDFALYDFNRDGVPEIVLSVGNGLLEQKVYVIQYHPPAMKEDRARLENWTSVTLTGQSDCYISADSISFRIGSRGFTDTHFFRGGKFYFKGLN